MVIFSLSALKKKIQNDANLENLEDRVSRLGLTFASSDQFNITADRRAPHARVWHGKPR